jgi:hypothetical protein
MAFRELVSNAIDRTIRETGNFDGVEIALVSDVSAKRGHTGWFIPADERVVKFYWELKKRFLHFAGKDELKATILPKTDRNPSGGQTAVIYKKGVYVREWTESKVPSQYDYNFGDDLDLDESRTVDNYRLREAVARKLAVADAGVATPVHFVERHIDPRYSFSEWTLRRSALQMARLRQCATVSVQSSASAFRRDNDSQVYLPVSVGAQTVSSVGVATDVLRPQVVQVRGARDAVVEAAAARKLAGLPAMPVPSAGGGGSGRR